MSTKNFPEIRSLGQAKWEAFFALVDRFAELPGLNFEEYRSWAEHRAGFQGLANA